MSKKSNRNLLGYTKKDFKGLERTGKVPNRKWEYKGKTFDTLSEVAAHHDKLVRAEAGKKES